MLDEMQNNNKTILIVDDNLINIQVLSATLQQQGYNIIAADSGKTAIKMAKDVLPDLILLDVMMPEMDGYEVCRHLKESMKTKNIPVIFLTAQTGTNDVIMGFDYGAVDYVYKPFNTKELLARVATHLILREQQLLLQDRELQLLKIVEEKTQKIEGITYALLNALENASLLNDNDTGNHIKRVSHYSAVLAEAYGCDLDFVKKVKLYSPLHDVGKVGIPDGILKKPGKLTQEEFEGMKQHVVFGFNMLNNKDLDDMPKNIALYHHERWDGTGYVNKLKGNKIPLEAKITTLADVYDALMSERSYKKAFSQEESEEIIKKESGKIFDPKLVEVFFSNMTKMIEIKEAYK